MSGATFLVGRGQRCRTPLWLALIVGLACGNQAAQSVSGAELSGSWRGHWENDNNNHRGPLRATFTKLNETQYRVRFSGRFFGVVPFRYAVVLNVVPADNGLPHSDTVQLQGTSTIGRRLTFEYSATATAQCFSANYSSCRYTGKFVLQKCCP